MARGVLERMRAAVRAGEYDLAEHALDEMAEDDLEVWDLEAAILTRELHERQRDDPRGTRYVIHGCAADQVTRVAAVSRFTETGRLLIITVYRLTGPEG